MWEVILSFRPLESCQRQIRRTGESRGRESISSYNTKQRESQVKKNRIVTVHHEGNHREGGLRVGRAPRTTVTVFLPSPPSSSSVMISTAVVRGLDEVDKGETTSGFGRRVLAGEGTVMVCVCVTVWVSKAVSEMINGGSAC